MEQRCGTCGVPLAYSGRGRPPKYCPEHKADAKRQVDRDKKRADRFNSTGTSQYRVEGVCRKCGAVIYRVRNVEPRVARPPTFYSPVAGGEVAYTKLHLPTKQRKRRHYRPTLCGKCRKRSTACSAEFHGFSRDPALRWTKAPAKCGYDTKVEKMIKEFFKDWKDADPPMCMFVEHELERNLTSEVLYVRETILILTA
jgi:hypothetical protein